MKQSEQILPAKVITILCRHAQVLSHQQTTNIKYRLTATDSVIQFMKHSDTGTTLSTQLGFC